MQPIQSPLNYTGGKYKLLKQILPLFPERINTFVDLFCGGASVGVNVECNHVVFNDISTPIIRLLQTFQPPAAVQHLSGENPAAKRFHRNQISVEAIGLSASAAADNAARVLS